MLLQYGLACDDKDWSDRHQVRGSMPKLPQSTVHISCSLKYALYNVLLSLEAQTYGRHTYEIDVTGVISITFTVGLYDAGYGTKLDRKLLLMHLAYL